MDLNFTKEQKNFQVEVRSFLTKNLEPQVVEKVKNGIPITKEDSEKWHEKLNETPRTPSIPADRPGTTRDGDLTCRRKRNDERGNSRRNITLEGDQITRSPARIIIKITKPITPFFTLKRHLRLRFQQLAA